MYERRLLEHKFKTRSKKILNWVLQNVLDFREFFLHNLYSFGRTDDVKFAEQVSSKNYIELECFPVDSFSVFSQYIFWW